MQPVFVSSLTGAGIPALTKQIAALVEQIRGSRSVQGYREPVDRDPRGINLTGGTPGRNTDNGDDPPPDDNEQ